MRRVGTYLIFLAVGLALASGDEVNEPSDEVRRLLSKRNGFGGARRLKTSRTSKTQTKKMNNKKASSEDSTDSTCMFTGSNGTNMTVEMETSSNNDQCLCCINDECGTQEECEAALFVFLAIFGGCCGICILMIICSIRHAAKRKPAQAGVRMQTMQPQPVITPVYGQPPGIVSQQSPAVYHKEVQQAAVVYGQAQQPYGMMAMGTQPGAVTMQQANQTYQMGMQPVMMMQQPQSFGQQQPQPYQMGTQPGIMQQQPQSFSHAGVGQLQPNPVVAQALAPAAVQVQVQAQAQPRQQTSTMTTLTVPKGYGPGKILKVNVEGKQVKVKIPEGKLPGMQFRVNLKAAAALS